MMMRFDVIPEAALALRAALCGAVLRNLVDASARRFEIPVSRRRIVCRS